MKNLILFLPVIYLLNCCQSAQKKLSIQTDSADLIKVDKEFSDYSVKNGMNAAFLRYASDEAVMLRPGGYPIEGIVAIKEMMTTRNDSSFVLSWEPLKAYLAGSGELGYTYGTFRLDTKENVQRGTYVTIWRKTNGEWKFVLDAGNEGLGE